MSVQQLEFSPDGKWVAWAGFESCGPGNRLWRARADGTDRLQLSDFDLECWAPLRWSPDGRHIAFSARVREHGHSRLRLYLVGSDGGRAEPLAPEEGAVLSCDPCWAPDGQSLVYGVANAPEEQLYLRHVDLATRHVTQLPGSKGLRAPKCSRDGRIFADDDASTNNSSGSDKRWFYKLLDPGGAVWNSFSLPEPLDYPNWSRDGRHIYALALQSRRIVRLEPSVSRLETVAEIDTFPLSGALWTGLTPDDSPMIIRDTGQWEIYRLGWEAP
jgi:Tol biopolymer transport system component